MQHVQNISNLSIYELTNRRSLCFAGQGSWGRIQGQMVRTSQSQAIQETLATHAPSAARMDQPGMLICTGV
jgi:hypothetical protein